MFRTVYWVSILHKWLIHFHKNNDGNVALIIAVSLLPILIAVGAAFDTARLRNSYAKVQADLDFALIAAVNEIGTEDKLKIEAKLKDWFESQQSNEGTFTLGSVKIDLSKDVVTATASGSVPTTLMGIVGYDQMPVKVTSSSIGADKPHTQIFFALDKSASMLLAATPEGQAKMQAEIGCAFACHISEGNVGRTSFKTNYEYSQARKITLRVDVATEAIAKSLDVVEEADPEHQRIKVGLYKIGSNAINVLDPTLNFSVVHQRLSQDSYGMTGSTSDETSYFDIALPQLTSGVGKSGDGRLESTPEKLVMIVTDGVESNRDWVFNAQNKVAPFNPKWCSDMKKDGVTVAVLYTQYLPMPWDWGYAATVGATMTSARWKETWNADRRAGVPGSISRHDYIPYALKDCASSEDLFLSASSKSEIEKGIKDLLRAFLSAPRLTQ